MQRAKIQLNNNNNHVSWKTVSECSGPRNTSKEKNNLIFVIWLDFEKVSENFFENFSAYLKFKISVRISFVFGSEQD